MTTHPTPLPGPSLTELRRAEVTARQVRRADAEPAAGHLRLVQEPSADQPWFASDAPAAALVGASAGARLDAQCRVTCAKLLKRLGWEPHVEVETFLRRDRRLLLVRRVPDGACDVDGSACSCLRCTEKQTEMRRLDDGWSEVREEVRITGKWELALTEAICHGAGLRPCGEVLAIAVPGLDGLVLTNPENVVSLLVDGVGLPTAAAPH